MEDFYSVLTKAVAYFTEHGYDNAESLLFWEQKLREAAERTMGSAARVREMLVGAYRAIFAKMVDKGRLAQYHQGVGRFTIERLRPQLRTELDRRILAAAQLIKLNRDQSIESTLRRFSGWATSIPVGGSGAVEKGKTKLDIKKSLAKLPFEERRVLIDQGHKLIASLNNVIAADGGAIAVRWRSHWRETNYNYREDHKLRDGKVYLLDESWARTAGLVKPGPVGLYSSITHVGEEVFCRCYGEYVYALRDLPKDMLTRKGQTELERVRLTLRS